MTVSEETAKRIADALERLITVMERAHPPQPINWGRCAICGKSHYGSDPCITYPRLSDFQ